MSDTDAAGVESCGRCIRSFAFTVRQWRRPERKKTEDKTVPGYFYISFPIKSGDELKFCRCFFFVWVCCGTEKILLQCGQCCTAAAKQ
ncbi:hypothetical protein JQM64_03795 [Fournierella massiliensis]|nr:hypothetical protein [Fournierella massiliensis]MCF2556642.1 hypothetical protein [Fournierella massiliensis]